MDRREKLQEYFQSFGCNVEGDNVFQKCLELCDLYDIDEENFVEIWLGFSASVFDNLDVTLDHLNRLDQDLLKKQYKQTNTRKSSNVSDTVEAYTTLLQDTTCADDILEMYGCNDQQTPSSKLTKGKRLRSPETPLENRDGKLQAVNATFSPSSYVVKPDTPTRYPTNVNRNKVLSHFGEEIASWSRETDYDVEVKQLDDGVPVNAKYMFSSLYNQGTILSGICRTIGERLCRLWHGADKKEIYYTRNVLYKSQVNFRTWGRICSDDDADLNAKNYVLESSVLSEETKTRCAIPLNLSGVRQYALYPGQIVAVEGSNIAGDFLNVKQIFTKGYAILSHPPRLQHKLNIMIAAGPFTSLDNLTYQPLFEFMEYVAKERPHVVILIGPFVEFTHPEISNATIKETYQEHFERLISRVMGYVEGKSVKVVLVASNRDAFHIPIFPTPEYVLSKDRLPNNGENLYLVPDPCILDIEGLTIGVTSVDVIKHIAKQELSNIPGSDRLTRLANHLLSQRCFYPLYPPALEVNVDTNIWAQHAFFRQQPHILLLPSDMRYYCNATSDCLVLNPERMVKFTYAKLCVRPDGKWNPRNVSCTIGKI